MLFDILRHTPPWVWGLLTLLVVLGLSQTRDRAVSLTRIVALPLGMSLFAMHGNASMFHASPWTWVLWLSAALASTAWFATSDLPAGQRYDARTRLVHMPGSWEPLLLMMAIFSIRYAVAVALALHPQARGDLAVAAIVATLYGGLGGIFIGRMVRTLMSTRRPTTSPSGTRSAAWG
jgi:hypothetical protein